MDKKPKNKKELEKLEKEKQEQHSNIIRHADYNIQKEKIDAPFGRVFKTGLHTDKKKEIDKGKEKHKGKGWE